MAASIHCRCCERRKQEFSDDRRHAMLVGMSDDDIVDQRIKGRSVQAIAKSQNMSVRDVHEIINRWSDNCIDDRLRKNSLALELERLDQLQSAFFERALDGDAQSGILCVKIVSHRSQLLGLCSAQQHVVQILESAAPRQTSTDRLEQVLAELESKSDAEVEAELQASKDQSTH
jgi:hypothetical protein